MKKMIVPRTAKGTPWITTSIPHAIENAHAALPTRQKPKKPANKI